MHPRSVDAGAYGPIQESGSGLERPSVPGPRGRRLDTPCAMDSIPGLSLATRVVAIGPPPDGGVVGENVGVIPLSCGSSSGVNTPGVAQGLAAATPTLQVRIGVVS